MADPEQSKGARSPREAGLREGAEALPNGHIRLSKISALTGKLNSLELPISQGDYCRWLFSQQLIQQAFPQLTSDQREFMLSGATPEEWNKTFGEGDEGEGDEVEEEEG